MTPWILLFTLSNLILLTVNITASRLILLLIIAMATLRTYKWILNFDEIDKFVLFPKASFKSTRHKKGT